MTEPPDHPALAAILANVGAEIRGPLGGLRDALGRIVEEPEAKVPSRRRAHALTMIALCEELDRLTRDTLDRDGSPGPSA